MLAELRYYSKMAVGIAKLLRTPIPSSPEQIIRDGFLRREENFLALVERVVFGQEGHPYAAMFEIAGCEPGDLKALVQRKGLDAALLQLRESGVYLTHQEWKGTQPIVRSGREIPRSADSFANPFVRGWFETSSSGSSGRPVKTSRGVDSHVHQWCYRLLRTKAFDMERRPVVEVRPILPFPTGMNMSIHGPRLGTPLDRWFSVGGNLSNAHYRVMTHAMLTMAKIMGAQPKFPEFLPPNDFLPVARHLALRKSQGKPCVVQGFASPLVRVAGAAIENGLDISGTLFLCGGEAMTSGKLDVFHEAGTRAFPSYVTNELNHAGASCQAMKGNSVHLLQDSIAAITFRRPAPYGEGAEVDSLHFTTLAPHASLVFINVEMDDEGRLEPATCDCVYSRLGFTTLITNIHSFGKMSPQGMTFHGTELQTVLEKELPQRLGGGPGDYQLVECEAANQQTQMRLYISPRVGLEEPQQARQVFLDLVRPRWGGALATRWWDHSDGLEVVVAEPVATGTGKVHPVRLLGAARGARKEVQNA